MVAPREIIERENQRLDSLLNDIETKPLRVRKVTASTPYGFVDEHLTPFGGLFSLEKLLDAFEIDDVFNAHFVAPARTPELGHWKMLKGVLNVDKLPVVTTYWRCLNSYGLRPKSISAAGSELVKLFRQGISSNTFVLSNRSCHPLCAR